MLRKTWECEANKFMLFFLGGGLVWVSTRLQLFLGIGSGGFSLASFLFRDRFTLHHGRWKLSGNAYIHAE